MRGVRTLPRSAWHTLGGLLTRLLRLLEAPNTYRPERHYMRGSGPKSDAKSIKVP